MFSYAKDFNGDLSTWDVSKVTDMNAMFQQSNFNGDLSTWDVSKVTNMGEMFTQVGSFNGDLSNWDVSKVTDMSSMFTWASSFNGDLSKWDVSKVVRMDSMFAYALSFSGDLSKWNVSRVKNMRYAFTADSCSLCDHMPHGLKETCISEACSPPECGNALSKKLCSVHAQCTWCKSKDHLHYDSRCFFKEKTPESGWVCEGGDVAADDLAHIVPLVLV